MEDVAKCGVTTCEKYSDCGYANSKGQLLLEFKYFCLNEDKFFMKYEEGEIYRVVESEKKEELLIEE